MGLILLAGRKIDVKSLAHKHELHLRGVSANVAEAIDLYNEHGTLNCSSKLYIAVMECAEKLKMNELKEIARGKIVEIRNSNENWKELL